MNRKEFEEKFEDKEASNWLREPIDVETIWQWIEQYGKEQRVKADNGEPDDKLFDYFNDKYPDEMRKFLDNET